MLLLAAVVSLVSIVQGFRGVPIAAKRHSSQSSSSARCASLPSRQFVELLSAPTSLLDGTDTSAVVGDRIPTSFIMTWPTYVLDLSPSTDDDTTTKSDDAPWTWSAIPDARPSATTDSDESERESTGFVNPVTFDTVWHPLDLKAPRMRLAVGLHIRNGQIRHVLPALDLWYPSSSLSTTNGADVADDGEVDRRPLSLHRNRGMRSVPRAHQWMDFTTFLATTGDAKVSCRLQVATTPKPSSSGSSIGATTNPESSSLSSQNWTTVQSLESIAESVSMAVTALSTNPPVSLGTGSCILHVLPPPPPPKSRSTTLTTEEDTDGSSRIENSCPIGRGSQIRVFLEEVEMDGSTVNDSSSSSSNSNSDEEANRPRVLGTLHVSVEPTTAGSESQFRPDCYTRLFTDPLLRRPAYTESRRRIRDPQQQPQQ